ncbi:FdhF/YdeP family oxidoreductase [Patulibacter sp. NPDC049589]|uniref:FdhF/YdeP family oxidoreductase n=1 Tax=Patulibacter sp. NPDC049589 TaxID=3154731 RepID=UPI00343626B7
MEAPKHHAVGLGATWSIAKQGLRHMGVARSAESLLRINQPYGFQCPSCAWPEPEDGAGLVEFCESGAKAVANEATRMRASRELFARHSLDDLRGRTGHWLEQQGRLTEPMYLAPGAEHYAPISWDEAFNVIARELRGLDSPDEATFYTSGRTSNEAAFAYQLFVRAYGTNNLPDCSNMCHESTSKALGDTIGIGKGSVSIEDLVAADLIIVAGQNPGTNHPRMLTTLEKAKEAGAKILFVNPLPEAGLQRFDNPQRPTELVGMGTHLQDLFLQIRLGGDLALFQAFSRLLLEADDAARAATREPVLDHEFLAGSTDGFEALQEHLRGLDWDDLTFATGLTRAEIDEAMALILPSKRIVVCWAMGLTQHRQSVPTIQEVVNFLLLRGNIGREGAGLCPVRGHSNVQGDRTMGIWEQPPEGFLDRLDEALGFSPPREHGLDVVNSVKAFRDGRLKVFVGMGGNFAAAVSDTEVTEAALSKARLTVQVSTKLNRSHLVTGREALILPTLGRTDRDLVPDGPRRGTPQFVTTEDSMSVVHASHGHLEPPSGELRSEVRIVCGMARAVFGPPTHDGEADGHVTPTGTSSMPDGHASDVGGGSGLGTPTGRVEDLPWEAMARDYGLIREQITAVIPGFEDFGARAQRKEGFRLPHPPRDERRFQTSTGTARLTVNVLEPIAIPDGHLLLQTLRSHDQYNTTVYGLNDRYRGIKAGRRVVLVRPEDLERLGVRDGAVVDLVSTWEDGVERRAPRFKVVAYPTARGCAAAYYPETNPLVPLGSTATGSNTPTSKSVVVRFESVRG